MPSVQRKGDPNSAGGVATGGNGSVRVNNQPVVVNGTSVSAHAPWGKPHPPHASAVTKGGNGAVKAGGVPINVTGNTDSCGHPRTGGSPNVRIG